MSDTVFIGSAKLMLSTLDQLKIEPVPFIEEALGRKINPNLPTDPYARIKYGDLEKKVAVIFDRETIQPDLHFLTDGMMTVFLGMCRANAGKELCPVSADFARPEPDCVKQYSDYFCCPVGFEASDNRLTFSQQSVTEHLSSSDPVVADASDQIIIDYLARMDDASIVDRVKAEIIKQLASGTMTDESIASSLYKSTRTMQRELKDEGTTFSAVVNEVRHDLAIKYVQDSRLSLTEIAFMLGFSESSSFTRAFKRWTGSAPSNFRI